MFDIRIGSAGEVIMAGRLDATHCEAALKFMNGVDAPRVIDLSGLEYVASAGLRVFLLTLKRVKGSASELRLINVTPKIHDIFRYAGFDRIFNIVPAP
jgi:anti-anti-sigma factor